MSYSDLVDGLHERFATVPELKVRLRYAPQSLHTTPAVYTLYDSFKRLTIGAITVMQYRVLCRALVVWQDQAAAEVLIESLANKLPACVDLDPYLGGRTGIPARVSEGRAGFATIGRTEYRAIDFYAELSEEGVYGGEI